MFMFMRMPLTFLFPLSLSLSLSSPPSPLSLFPEHFQLPPQLLNQDMTYPPPPSHGPLSISSSAFHSSLDELSSLELPHSCSNGSDDQLESLLVSAPHMWLCDGSLLCLLEPRHPDNLSAFQVHTVYSMLSITARDCKRMYTVYVHVCVQWRVAYGCVI